MSDNSLLVKSFTEESSGKVLPTHPIPMTYGEFFFISKMVISELMELGATFSNRPEEDLRKIMNQATDVAEYPTFSPVGKSEIEIITEQADALVDVLYYTENAGGKKAWYLKQLFDKVHEANMNKRWEDGQYHRDDSGKVIKPPGWEPADLVPIVQRWKDNGTWSC